MSEVVVKGGSQILFRCPNCRTKKIHCIAGGKEGEPVEMLKDRCNDTACQCRCRRKYEANNGKLYPYGTIDDTSALEDFQLDKKRNKADDIIDELNDKFNEARKDRMVITKK